MPVEEVFDFIYGGIGNLSGFCLHLLWVSGVLVARLEHLFYVVVFGKLPDSPLGGFFPVVPFLSHHVAHPHHILVVVAGFVPDFFVFQLGFDDLLVVVGDAILFLFLLCGLERSGMEMADFLGAEGCGFGIEIDFGVVGESAEPCDVLAERIAFLADEMRVVVVSHGEGGGIIIAFVAVDDAQSVAAHGNVAEQGVGIVADSLFERAQGAVIRFFCDVVEVDQ